jgi:F-type H+-transporting ATPase subunit gamma
MDRLYLALLDVRPAAAAVGPPPPRDPAAAATVLVVVAGDRGFCGPYNKDVLARAAARAAAIRASHPRRSVELVLVGCVAAGFFARTAPGTPVTLAVDAGRPGSVAATVAHVCDAVLSAFIGGGVERVEVIYTRFTSLVSNAVAVRTLLPVTPSGLEVPDDEVFQLTSRDGRLAVAPRAVDRSPRVAVAVGRERRARGDRPPPRYAVSEEGAVLLLNAMLPMYVHSQLTRMLRDAVAAELACRMQAMNAANDNCNDISKSLKDRYNRERQAMITAEVIMVAGPRE